jgi:ligand-binding SRPBCC domain-containing protein
LIEVSTRLAAPAASVWERAVTADGINDELRPILRMTVPRDLDGATIDDVAVGEPLGRSWILLGGVVPVDYDDLRLAELEPGRRFRERSSTSGLRVWIHERAVEPGADGTCTVTDRLDWEPRRLLVILPGGERLVRAIVGFLFRHRHRQLARYWGAVADSRE